MNGTWLGIAGAALVIGAWAVWGRLMARVRVPRNRVPFLLVFGLAVVLGIAAFVNGAGIVGSIAAVVAILGGGVFLGLQLQSGQDSPELAVALGGPILDFAAPDDAGEIFELASLRGTPFLLKFFRGHW